MSSLVDDFEYQKLKLHAKKEDGVDKMVEVNSIFCKDIEALLVAKLNELALNDDFVALTKEDGQMAPPC